MQIGTEEAADRLQISTRRMRVLLETGRINAQRVSGRWIIDDGDLARFRFPRSAGRPLSPRSAWQLINHIQQNSGLQLSTRDLEPIERHRLEARLGRLKAAEDPLEVLCSMLAKRAERFELSVSPVDLRSLRQDPRIRLSGICHPASGLLANAEVEAYVAREDYDTLVKDWFLVQVSAGSRANVVLHVAELVPEKTPVLLVAVDLAERGGVREEEAARELIGNLNLG